ncbi:hypothetical protein [Sphingomonas sp.]|uniref:hypothetical protein n=1 Tax=Sphingomonas sp. TaxID=28214 RepID=UPI00257BC845|nr:hypothetical protein [Sphingomonas sp.]
MTAFEGQYFESCEVPLDGNQFRGCDFVGVTFVFAGLEGFEIGVDCTYRGQIRMKLGPNARMALVSLIKMFSSEMLGPAIRHAIEYELAKGPDSFDE